MKIKCRGGIILSALFFITFLSSYTRSSKDEILENFVRGEIYGFIKSNPGCYYSHIKKKLDIKNGVLAYHLKILEKSGLIKSERKGRYRLFTVTGITFPKSGGYILSELQISILDLIEKNRGISQKEIDSLEEQQLTLLETDVEPQLQPFREKLLRRIYKPFKKLIITSSSPGLKVILTVTFCSN